MFQSNELEQFEKWYKAGYNVTTNSRYTAWLSTTHPEYVWMKPICSTGVEQFLSVPKPPCSIPTVKRKSCGRVLTSQENIDMMNEKEEVKKQAQLEKERKKQVREAKQIERQTEKGTYS